MVTLVAIAIPFAVIGKIADELVQTDLEKRWEEDAKELPESEARPPFEPKATSYQVAWVASLGVNFDPKRLIDASVEEFYKAAGDGIEEIRLSNGIRPKSDESGEHSLSFKLQRLGFIAARGHEDQFSALVQGLVTYAYQTEVEAQSQRRAVFTSASKKLDAEDWAAMSDANLTNEFRALARGAAEDVVHRAFANCGELTEPHG